MSTARLLAAFITATALSSAGRAQEKPAIAWASDLSAARERAREQKKPVIAFFTFDTCHWCKVLEKETFPDAAVVELSRKLIWVEVNRDHTPEIAERFHVEAYPSLLILGDADENVYRFSGYKPPPEFVRELNEGLRRFALYREGKEWSEPVPRAAVLTDAAKITTWKAPVREVSHGVTFVDDLLLVAQEQQLRALKNRDGEVAYAIELPGLVNDLATDGHLVYAATYGWSKGDPIFVIDPVERRVVRSIVTKENEKNPESSTYGVAWRDGKLFVLARGAKIHQVDPETGAIERVIPTAPKRLFGLDWDGTSFISADENGLVFLDDDGQVVRRMATNYRLRIVAFHDGRYFVMEQPEFGFDKQHEQIMVWPKEMLIYELELNAKR